MKYPHSQGLYILVGVGAGPYADKHATPGRNSYQRERNMAARRGTTEGGLALFMVEIRASHTGEGIFELRTGAWKKQQSREKLGSRQEAKRSHRFSYARVGKCEGNMQRRPGGWSKESKGKGGRRWLGICGVRPEVEGVGGLPARRSSSGQDAFETSQACNWEEAAGCPSRARGDV